MRSSLVLVAALASVGVGVAGGSEPKTVALGERFTLKVGGSAQIEGGEVLIGFENVSADSRCPKGEQCIREGDAAIRVWLQKGSGPKETLEIRTSSQDEGAVAGVGYAVKLLRLDPYPVSGKAIERADYLATLQVARGAATSATPDR